MAVLHDDVLDDGLQALTDATSKVLHICSAEPSSFANVASVTLGNKTPPTVGAPEARAGSGRKVVVSAITDGAVTATATATHYAIVDGSRLLAANTLAASQGVTDGNVFTLAAFDIGIPAPA
jgi:hypothetical protein